MSARPLRRGRPATVTTEDVVLAAVELIERDGLEALTMRSLASSMGVAPMTLYRHVADKEALLSMIPDALLGDVCAEVMRKRSGLAALRAVADGLADVLERHPGVAHLFARPERGTRMERATAHVVALLAAEGLGESEAWAVLRAVVAQVIGEVITMHGRYDPSGVRLVLEGVRRRLEQRNFG